MNLLSKQNGRKFLIGVLVLGILVIALMPQQGFAATEKPAPGRSIVETIGGCGWLSWLSIGCALKLLSYVAYYVFVIVAWFVGIAGNILNFALGITINNAFYAGGSITAVTAGWTFTRDIVNIFFIFALLFIAIATILGIESYGAKKLLSTLIIIALLVNFSLLATQAIIFVTNALAYELYSVVTVTGVSSKILSNYAQPGFNRDIAGAIMQGIGQQRLFNVNPSGLQPGSSAPPTSAAQVNIAVIVTLGASIFIMAFSAFIFLAGAFFFAARMAVLWILMVLAPFGFVFLILPATKGYAQKWWTTLQSQALFAPAFMFFIIITVKMSNADLFGIVRRINSNPNMGATDLIFLLIIQSTVIFLLLGGSLIIAKTLGIYGAGAAIGMAAGAGKALRGYVGKGALRMGALPARGLNKLATAPGRIPYAGPVFRALLKPLTAATGAAVRVTDKEKTERQESWKKLSPIALAETYRGAVNPLTRKEILKAAGESGKLDKFSEGELQTAYSQFKDKPSDAKAYNNVVKARPDLIEKDSSLSPADKRTRMTDALSRMSEKDIEEKLDKKTFDP